MCSNWGAGASCRCFEHLVRTPPATRGIAPPVPWPLPPRTPHTCPRTATRAPAPRSFRADGAPACRSAKTPHPQNLGVTLAGVVVIDRSWQGAPHHCARRCAGTTKGTAPSLRGKMGGGGEDARAGPRRSESEPDPTRLRGAASRDSRSRDVGRRRGDTGVGASESGWPMARAAGAVPLERGDGRRNCAART